ncbi:receptor-like protein EIX2 [Prosopis cineraria]|uniref:receptor-like protein EIX2 n=1 Tax=Prosopis cineraria TaxID=364024 RepID=UPI00240F6C5C|nr:receptor-like protein EIX2 [Prosopis cineraria]
MEDNDGEWEMTVDRREYVDRYPNNAKSCMESDKEALLKLKDGFIDDSGTLSPWEHEVDCCKWSGISCNHSTGYVIMFDLHNYYLKGDIDSSLCDLRHLVLLNLDFNQFDGSKIPKCIDSLDY